MSLDESSKTNLQLELMRRAGRSLVLVPNETARSEIAERVRTKLGFMTYSAEDIEDSKKPFVTAPKAAAVVANRYDGIDFPGDECRLLFIEGLPKASNAQERFLMSRMGANILLNERIQTRVLQAIGRCTRSLEDYSAVVVSGAELPDYLANIKRRPFLHPELQAELLFGIEQSKERKAGEFIDNFQIFLKNGKEWEAADQEIIAARNRCTQEPFPGMSELRSAVQHELNWQKALWQGDFDAALLAAERVLGELKSPELRGYRALWHYLAGAAAWLGARVGNPALEKKSREHFGAAKGAAMGIEWLVALSQFNPSQSAGFVEPDPAALEQLERLEAMIESFGTLHEGLFAAREKTILEGLSKPETFENAQKLLGELLGFFVGKAETDGSPDPWWISGKYCFVFEDYVNSQEDTALSVTKARQAESHPNWMRENVPASKDCEITPVLVTAIKAIKKGAIPHAKETALWSLNDFIGWSENALATIRQLRSSFVEPGDLAWKAIALESLERNNLTATALHKKLKATSAAAGLKKVN
jgi:hypothetical protein